MDEPARRLGKPERIERRSSSHREVVGLGVGQQAAHATVFTFLGVQIGHLHEGHRGVEQVEPVPPLLQIRPDPLDLSLTAGGVEGVLPPLLDVRPGTDETGIIAVSAPENHQQHAQQRVILGGQLTGDPPNLARALENLPEGKLGHRAVEHRARDPRLLHEVEPRWWVGDHALSFREGLRSTRPSSRVYCRSRPARVIRRSSSSTSPS